MKSSISPRKKYMRFDTEKFYLGKLCKRGHDHEDTGKSLRYKSDRDCVECVAIRYKKWLAENPKKRKRYIAKQSAKRFRKTIRGRLSHILASMKQRCYNPKDPKYKRYGKRGITIYQTWLTTPEIFKKWALANGYVVGLTIDRINNDGNYCPDNCQWLTRTENASKGSK